MSWSLIDKAPDNIYVITSGGFEDAAEVHCNRADVDVNDLKAIHMKKQIHVYYCITCIQDHSLL